MTKLRRRSLTETRQIALIVDSETETRLFCPSCGESVRMVSPLLAAKLFRISTREIYLLIEAGNSHFVEFEDRQIFVCLKTLKAEIQN